MTTGMIETCYMNMVRDDLFIRISKYHALFLG